MSFILIPRTDPRCQEIQNGHDDYPDGLILAQGHFTDLDHEWLVGPVTREGSVTIRYANVHDLNWLPRVDGMKVYGIRQWQDRCSGRGYMTRDRQWMVTREYIKEHYKNVREVGSETFATDSHGDERAFKAADVSGWHTS